MRDRALAAVLLSAVVTSVTLGATACSGNVSLDLLQPHRSDAGARDAAPPLGSDDDASVDDAAPPSPPPRGFAALSASTTSQMFTLDTSFYAATRAEVFGAAPPDATASSPSADCNLRFESAAPAPEPARVRPAGGTAVLRGAGGAELRTTLALDQFETGADFPVGFEIDDATSQIIVSVQGSDAVPSFDATVSLAPAVALVDPASGATPPTDGSDVTVRWTGSPADLLLFALMAPSGTVACTLHPTSPGVAVVPGTLVQRLFAAVTTTNGCDRNPACVLGVLSNQRTTDQHVGDYEIELAHMSMDAHELSMP